MLILLIKNRLILFLKFRRDLYGSYFKLQAAVSGLQNQPIINAVIDGDDIIYRDYIDISIAVGTPKASFNFFIPGTIYLM